MTEKDLKVFIGPHRIGNIGSVLASAFRERGIKVTHAINRITSIRAESGMEYDILLNLPGPDFKGLNKLRQIVKYLCYSLKFFLQHNTFIFMYGESLLPYNLDLPILKLFRKKTVMRFVGSDIRCHESLAAAAEKTGMRYFIGKGKRTEPKVLKRKLRMVRMVERYVDYIISGPSFSQLLTREYCRIYIPQDVCNIRYNNTPNSKPIVVHAPSNPEIKGTPYILEAVEHLKREGYDFEFYLFRNTSNTKLRETLSGADIAVDQLFATAPSSFAIESMAAGCAVLGGNVPEFAGFPPELPIIHTDPDNIDQNLKMLLENSELRRELGKKGRNYVEEYHDHRKIADNIIKLIT